MTEVTNEQMYEVLNAMQTRLTNIEIGVGEVRTELRAIRTHMVAVQTDVGNLHAGQANIDERLSRIERRLELTDAPAG
jgi:chromosome segregation ATPase